MPNLSWRNVSEYARANVVLRATTIERLLASSDKEFSKMIEADGRFVEKAGQLIFLQIPVPVLIQKETTCILSLFSSNAKHGP